MAGPEQPSPPDAPAPSAPPVKPADVTAAATPPPKPETNVEARQQSLPTFLRHLAGVGAAWGPVPSADGTRVAFVTTLFGSRQAALIPTASGYPVQLTDEPGGVLALRWAPQDPHLLFATVLRAGHRRVLLVDDAGGPPQDLDPAPGDQLLGGFTRDGKRLLYAAVDGDEVALKWLTLEGRHLTVIAPPLPQAGTPPRPAGAPPLPPLQPLSKTLAGLQSLTAPSADGRTAIAQVRKGADENLVLVDLTTTRADVVTPHEGSARFRFPRFTADGKQAYVLTDVGRAGLGVDLVNLADKKRKPLFAPQNEVEAFALADDGHKLAAAQVSGGETLFTLLELPSLRQQPLPQPPPGALQMGAPGEAPIIWSRGGDRIYFAWGRADDTVDVYVLRADFGNAQRLTRSPRPGLPEGSLPRPKLVTYPSFDGRQIPALLWGVKPLGKVEQGQRPRAAVVLTGAQARPVLDTRIAALAAANVAALAPSLRGSEGRGRAHAAEDAPGALQDISFAARFLREQPDLDASQPLLVGIGAGAEQAVAAALRDPEAWSGVVLLSDERPKGTSRLKPPHLVIGAQGAAALSELVAFARERFGTRTSARAQ
jgi:dipeptidyl aminopeptidase/acylaminoacyl peptidase